MDFKKGYKIKPQNILHSGEVVFTDGTNEVRANQDTCLAYGYKYNIKTATCYAFKDSVLITNSRKMKREGSNNKVINSRSSLATGSSNKIKGDNANILVTGESNEVELGIRNSSVLGGKYGKVLRQSEVLIGGGGLETSSVDGIAGLTQMSILQLAGSTTNATETNLSIQNDGESYITVQSNSLLAFECHVNALVTGGDDATAGHYRYEKIVGTILINEDGDRTYNQTTTTVKSSGTVGGTATTLGNTGTDVAIAVVGTLNINIQWYASIILIENKLATVTF